MKIYTPIIIFLLFTAPILQGCMSGALIAGTTAVAISSIFDPRTIGTQVDDTTLKIRIANALSKDKKIKKEARIINTPYQGKILLTGQARTIELIERAKCIAENVQGVIEVYNEIRQSRPISFKSISMDAWITVKIKLKLLTCVKKLNTSNIKIITENKEVFLLGLVTYQEGKIVADIASKVKNVKQVIIAFIYI